MEVEFCKEERDGSEKTHLQVIETFQAIDASNVCVPIERRFGELLKENPKIGHLVVLSTGSQPKVVIAAEQMYPFQLEEKEEPNRELKFPIPGFKRTKVECCHGSKVDR